MPIEKSGNWKKKIPDPRWILEIKFFSKIGDYETRKRHAFSHFEKRITNWLNLARKENHKNFLLWTTMPSQFWLCFVWIGVSFLGFHDCWWIKITITLSIGLSRPQFYTCWTKLKVSRSSYYSWDLWSSTGSHWFLQILYIIAGQKMNVQKLWQIFFSWSLWNGLTTSSTH